MNNESNVSSHFYHILQQLPRPKLFPYTTLFRSTTAMTGHQEHPGTEIDVLGNHTWLQDIESIVDRKSTRLNSSHANISYAVFCLKKKNIYIIGTLFL